jgi:hypothetical protein
MKSMLRRRDLNDDDDEDLCVMCRRHLNDDDDEVNAQERKKPSSICSSPVPQSIHINWDMFMDLMDTLSMARQVHNLGFSQKPL